jgi:DNA-binding SARP family transcriptional activator
VSRLKLHLLGTPRIERDGAPVEVDTRKAIALLAYLAVTNQPHSRDALAALFWPDYDQTRARATLRRTLSALNKALDGEWLDAGRETVGLSRVDLWTDVEEFARQVEGCVRHGAPSDELCAACVEQLAAAATLYRGDFMAGFTLRDSPSFDDWQFFQAESLRRDLAGVLERLARCHSARGEHEQAIANARRWLALDPLHEPVHRELMRLYAAAGRKSAALHQYRECVRVLEKELGVPPLEETTQLYQAIKENRFTADDQRPGAGDHAGDQRPRTDDQHPAAIGGGRGDGSAAPPSPPPGPSSSVARPSAAVPGPAPLVGRDAEWAALLAAYGTVGADGHLVALEGEGGIGKTRLAEEFLEHVRGRGGACVAVRCYEGESDLAYGPLATGLRAFVAQPARAEWHAEVPPHWLSEAARLLPELAARSPGLPPAPPLESPGAQNRFFEGLSQVLLAVCRGPAPGVLFIDDLHWADGASLDLLTYFVRRLKGRPVFVLVSWRSEQVPPGHRLRQLLAEAQRARSATLLTIGRLGPEAVRALVQAAGGEALPDDFGARLHQETEGLPLFVVEYLASVTHGGTQAASEWTLPSSVRDVLHARLASASETASQILATAAVIGRSFEFDTLREASGRSEEEAVTALEELIALGLVAEAREYGLMYDFSHEKLRALVYEETSLARRRLLHRRAADALAGRARARRDPGAIAGQIAHHYREAGQAALAADHFKLAADHARALYANAEALSHASAALALGHPAAAALHEMIGDLHTLRGDYGAALISYETAAALADPETLPAIELKLGGVHHRRGAWDQAQSHYQAALATLGEEGPPGERARVFAEWSLTAHLADTDGGARAARLAGEALALAEAGGDERALAQSHNILGVLATSRQDIAAAIHHLERSLQIAEALSARIADAFGVRSARIAALNNLALAYGANRDMDRALEVAGEALRLAEALGDRHREAALHNNLADLMHAAGRSGEAMAHLKQAVAIYAEIGVEAGAVRPEIWKLSEW